jgi:GR25 family glycosyltransferase involved in LPS biosynthesis
MDNIMINNFFEHIYCINLEKRFDRWEECQKEFEKLSIKNVEQFDATDGHSLPNYRIRPGEAGIVASNMRLFQDAIQKNYSNILVLEDDVEFSLDTNHLLSQIPEDWEILYFGGNHSMGTPQIINDKIAVANKTLAAHAIAFKKCVFEKLLELMNFNEQIDITYAYNLHLFKSYVFYPSIAWQKAGYSDINNDFVNYDYCLK